MRKIRTLENGNQKAIIYRNTDWDEYVTQYFVGGAYLGEACDNHTNDKDDAIASAEAEMKRGMAAPAPSADVETFGAELLSDIAATAMMGGVDAWADAEIVTAKAGRISAFRVTDSDDSSVSKLVTLETIAKGIRAILDNADLCNDEIREAVQAAITEKDAGHIDAWAADAIVQLGAFGEIVYG